MYVPGMEDAEKEGATTEIVELNIGDVRISFLNDKDEPLKHGEAARTCKFLIEGPGIDPKRVRSVEIPKLDYGSVDLLTIKVEMCTFDPSAGLE